MHTTAKQHIGLQTIFLLTCKHPANTLAAGDGGAINLAVRAIRSFPLNSPLLLQAFSLLGQLAVQPQFHEHILNLGAFKLAVSALSRLSKTMDVCGSACYLLVNLTSAEAVASDALSMGAMELALSALRHHGGASRHVSRNSSALLHNLCFDESRAVKAQQLGAPALLQAMIKAHSSDKEDVQSIAAAALARIQRFVDAARARADAKMAELIAGEEAVLGAK